MKSSWETDLVLSFMGSVTFWLTVLGFAFRRLRIDMQQLEQYLKAIYQDIDNFRIDYWQWTRIALQRTFTAIYGQPGHARFIYVVAAATISMNGFGLIAIHRDW